MIVRDEVVKIIMEYEPNYVYWEGPLETKEAGELADKILLYIQQAIVDKFNPGAWRDTLHKSEAVEITEYIINKGEAIHGK